MNHNAFEIGEIAIGQGLVHWPEYNGLECEILSPLEYGIAKDARTGDVSSAWRYSVCWANGHQSTVRYYNLRKKDLPPDVYTEPVDEEINA